MMMRVVVVHVASRNAGGVVVVVGRKERGDDSGVGVECVSLCVYVFGVWWAQSSTQ